MKQKSDNVDLKNLVNGIDLGPIFFVTPNPNRGIGLEKEIDNYHIIYSQKSDIVDYLKKESVSVFCLNDDKIKSSGKILANKKAIKYIKEKSKNKTANIITFKPSPMIQKVCDDNNFKYLGNNWRLNRKLENKVELVRITEKLKIPNANSKIVKIEENSKYLNNLFKSKKRKFVIQLPRGFSGKSTFLIKSGKDLAKIIKKYKNREAKLSEYLEGDAYTVNACVGRFGVAISQPIFQITGLASYNRNKLGTCGNDYVYGKKLKSEEKKKIFDCTRKIGEYMGELGYRGIFGLDFIVSRKDIRKDTKRPTRRLVFSNMSSDVNLIEINPRLVGSIPVFTKLQIKNNQLPFLILHIMEFLSLPTFSEKQKKITFLSSGKIRLDVNFKTWNKSEVFYASQLILRNIKKHPFEIIKPLASGIYEIKQGKLVLKEKAYYMKRNLDNNELLVQCASKNSVINPDMEYANVQASYGIMKNKQKFKSYFNKIANLILKNISVSI